MVTTLVLALPNFEETFTVETDTCATSIGDVMMQMGRPIAFLSKALSDKHRHLSIYEKEFLALIMAVERWRAYLQRKELVVKTDHKNLCFLDEQQLQSDLQKKAMTNFWVFSLKLFIVKAKKI